MSPSAGPHERGEPGPGVFVCFGRGHQRVEGVRRAVDHRRGLAGDGPLQRPPGLGVGAGQLGRWYR